jgi:hypothetical protein
MSFIKTANEELIALSCVARIFELEHADGSKRAFAVMHPIYRSEPIDLARFYTVEALWAATDPLRRR